MFVVVEAEVPKFVQESHQEYDPLLDRFQTSYDNSVAQEKVKYVSEIFEVENINEDVKYKTMDRFEQSVSISLESIEHQVKTDVTMRTFDGQELLPRVNSEILNRRVHVFDSYKEASIHRKVTQGYHGKL